jgi:hypothetical protein
MTGVEAKAMSASGTSTSSETEELLPPQATLAAANLRGLKSKITLTSRSLSTLSSLTTTESLGSGCLK